MVSPYSRNEYATAATHYLIAERHEASEGHALLQAVLPDLPVAVLPSPLYAKTHITCSGVYALLHAHELVAATDAAIVGSTHGCSVVLCDLRSMQTVTCSTAHEAYRADPSALETVARFPSASPMT